jgi:hypothetical protein
MPFAIVTISRFPDPFYFFDSECQTVLKGSIFYFSICKSYSEYNERVCNIMMTGFQHKTRENRLPRTLFCGPRPLPKSCGLIGQVFYGPGLLKRLNCSAVGEWCIGTEKSSVPAQY